ncbi:MAG: hypothetical protein Q9186_006931 [Xanthomendoza sp. 1 TL-2023]
MASATKRACDACHRRKVSKSSDPSCLDVVTKWLIQAGLACTYDAIPQKKGPKGSRAKVISELRLKECQKKAEHRRQDSMHNYGSPTSSPSSPTIPGLLTQELIEECMDYYFTQLYPTMPIMQKDQMGILMDEMETSVEAHCLLYSFCAFMLIQPGIEAKAGQALGSRTTLGKRLLDDALRRRKAYALQKHRPLTLHATINLPSVAEDPSIPVAGFIHLVNLYRPFDDTFIGLWNKSRTDCSTLWLAHLQKQLSQALPAVLDGTETQAADLKTSQHWLRTMVWQLSITNGFLSSTSPDTSMTFGYPIEIAKDLVAVTSQLSRGSMEVHGVGLIEKIFDVACTLIDVLSCVPIESQNFGIGPQDYLNHLVHLISTLRDGKSRYLPLVITKIRDTLPPHMAASMTLPMIPIKVEQSPEIPFLQDSSETHSSNTSSPYSTPPFMHYYPTS